MLPRFTPAKRTKAMPSRVMHRAKKGLILAALLIGTVAVVLAFGVLVVVLALLSAIFIHAF
jgi:hypothetical protein